MTRYEDSSICPSLEPRQQQRWDEGSRKNHREGLIPCKVPGGPSCLGNPLQGEKGYEARKSGPGVGASWINHVFYFLYSDPLKSWALLTLEGLPLPP